jgi:predicted  nucleic acid-binding Zn-ribbon protein
LFNKLHAALRMQANLAESQQSACETQDQLSQLLKELNTAEGKAASLARLHAEADEQLRQQASLLDQVCCSTYMYCMIT